MKAICVVYVSICACALTIDFQYAKVDKECNQYKKCVPGNPRLPNVELQQNEIYTGDHLVDSSGVVLLATRKISVPKELYAHNRETEFASSVLLEYI